MKYLDWLAEHKGEDAIRKMVNDRWGLQCKLSIAEKKLDLAVKGLERIKLYFKKVGGGTSVFPYIPMSRGDYEMGEQGASMKWRQ